MRGHEGEWTELMRAANAGDEAAYHRLLTSMAPVLRATAQRGLVRAGQPADQCEDIVQEILLAVHLKRHTWDATAPFGPWVFAIARNKLIDALRKRGRRVFVDIDDFAEVLPSEPPPERLAASEINTHLETLPLRQREVLQAISVEGVSISETAKRLSMSEGAVRVALHRGLASLASRLRRD